MRKLLAGTRHAAVRVFRLNGRNRAAAMVAMCCATLLMLPAQLWPTFLDFFWWMR